MALAQLLAEDRQPPSKLWEEQLVSSRLLEYELWVRLQARSLAASHGDPARLLVARIALLELAQPILGRALSPFPVSVRTLDAIHLASATYPQERGQLSAFATYDLRMQEAAVAMGMELFAL